VHIEIRNARGRVTHQADAEFGSSASLLPVPSGGLARISRTDPAA
jgi:hypothetical protein